MDADPARSGQGRLDALPDIERNILERRFGWAGRPEPLDSIARDLGLTLSEAEQLEKRARKRLDILGEALRAYARDPACRLLKYAVATDDRTESNDAPTFDPLFGHGQAQRPTAFYLIARYVEDESLYVYELDEDGIFKGDWWAEYSVEPVTAELSEHVVRWVDVD